MAFTSFVCNFLQKVKANFIFEFVAVKMIVRQHYSLIYETVFARSSTYCLNFCICSKSTGFC